MRGPETASYYAPEVLFEPSAYTEKSDIWSMGCILFELASQQKAFGDDADVYLFNGSPRALSILPNGSFVIREELARSVALIDSLVNEMLQIKPGSRPSAQSLILRFNEAVPMDKEIIRKNWLRRLCCL